MRATQQAMLPPAPVPRPQAIRRQTREHIEQQQYRNRQRRAQPQAGGRGGHAAPAAIATQHQQQAPIADDQEATGVMWVDAGPSDTQANPAPRQRTQEDRNAQLAHNWQWSLPELEFLLLARDPGRRPKSLHEDPGQRFLDYVHAASPTCCPQCDMVEPRWQLHTGPPITFCGQSGTAEVQVRATCARPLCGSQLQRRMRSAIVGSLLSGAACRQHCEQHAELSIL